MFESLDILFERFAAGAGPRRADRIRRGDDDRVNVVYSDVVMMPLNGVEDILIRFAVALRQFGADFWMAAFHFVVGRLTYVVQETAPTRQSTVEMQFVSNHAGQ